MCAKQSWIGLITVGIFLFNLFIFFPKLNRLTIYFFHKPLNLNTVCHKQFFHIKQISLPGGYANKPAVWAYKTAELELSQAQAHCCDLASDSSQSRDHRLLQSDMDFFFKLSSDSISLADEAARNYVPLHFVRVLDQPQKIH